VAFKLEAINRMASSWLNRFIRGFFGGGETQN